MRPGPKLLPADVKAAHGETRPSRAVVALYPDHASQPDPEAIDPPSGMTLAAKKIWAVKVDRYRKRGQKIDGFQDALRQFCELEASLNKSFKKGEANMAMVNAYRLWSGEFYDTPASQTVPVYGKQKETNGFGNNGRRPSGA